ncbi:sulfatase [Daejeonella sp.]|uniref:sulfatase n=1 Tax=Daejeonella sp. TaxID=2805397 RepID=UPI0030BC3447
MKEIRPFLKATFVCLLTAYSISVNAQPEKPNIVLILIDDMGFRDVGFNGSDFYQTPNINALAKEGMIFTNAYAAAGNCAPSRACLISGQYTPRHGIYAVGSTKRCPVNKMRLQPIPNKQDLNPAIYTIAEAMRDGGYRTGMYGKWHLGKTAETSPKGQGFEVVDTFDPPSDAEFASTKDPKGIYRITSGASKFMEDNKDRPFFLYVAHHATHMMIQANDDMYAKFKGKAGEYQTNEKYAAMNGQVDDGVGKLLQKIKDLGIEKNTLVIFTTDNGGLPQSPQNPLRGFKGMYYEGGIRVPFIAKWPGKIQAGSVNNTPVINLDLFPTFLDAGNIKKPVDKILDGESIKPLFAGSEKLKRDAIFWHFPGYLDNSNPGSRDKEFRTRPVTTLRKGNWKLLLYHEEWALDGGRSKMMTNNSLELYNLKDDISEKKNLASVNTAKRDELLADLLAKLSFTGGKIPTTRNPLFGKVLTPEQIKKAKEEAGNSEND